MGMKYSYNKLFTNAKDYVMMVIFLAIGAFGFTAFILPHEVIMGGLNGVGSLGYFATNKVVPGAVTQYACNLILLSIAYKVVGKSFVMRTILGATLFSLFIGLMEGVFMSLEKPLIPDTTVSILLGSILCGVGIGTVFVHNGSTGGTDIVAAMVSKVSNQSIGRTMIYVDMIIVSMTIFLPFEGTLQERFQERVPIMVYGLMVTYIIAFMADMVINTNRQAIHFTIFSRKWEEIANAISTEARRGVTVTDAQGWYSKETVKVLTVYCRKTESVTIFRIVKSIDPEAFITQTNTNGVYGKGFDEMKVKIKSNGND